MAELLIMEVQDRPCLWDQRLPFRIRGPEALKRAWGEIAAAVGIYVIYSIYSHIMTDIYNFCHKRNLFENLTYKT